jgi:hypothetical protein
MTQSYWIFWHTLNPSLCHNEPLLPKGEEGLRARELDCNRSRTTADCPAIDHLIDQTVVHCFMG